MKKTTRNPDEHLRSLPPGVRDDMIALDSAISAAMPDRSRVVWEGTFWGGRDQTIIGYGDLRQPRPKGDVEWFVVGLARQKNYISVYVNAVDGREYLGPRFADRLGKVKLGASSISFTRLADIDLDVLTELVGRANQLCPPDS